MYLLDIMDCQHPQERQCPCPICQGMVYFQINAATIIRYGKEQSVAVRMVQLTARRQMFLPHHWLFSAFFVKIPEQPPPQGIAVKGEKFQCFFQGLPAKVLPAPFPSVHRVKRKTFVSSLLVVDGNIFAAFSSLLHFASLTKALLLSGIAVSSGSFPVPLQTVAAEKNIHGAHRQCAPLSRHFLPAAIPHHRLPLHPGEGQIPPSE